MLSSCNSGIKSSCKSSCSASALIASQGDRICAWLWLHGVDSSCRPRAPLTHLKAPGNCGNAGTAGLKFLSAKKFPVPAGIKHPFPLKLGREQCQCWAHFLHHETASTVVHFETNGCYLSRQGRGNLELAAIMHGKAEEEGADKPSNDGGQFGFLLKAEMRQAPLVRRDARRCHAHRQPLLKYI